MNYIARVNDVMTVTQYYFQYKNGNDSIYIYFGGKWNSNKINPHLYNRCSKQCKPDADDTDKYVCISEQDNCWKDLYYRDKENYVLVSDYGDYVCYKDYYCNTV